MQHSSGSSCSLGEMNTKWIGINLIKQEQPDSPSGKGHHSIDEEMQLVLRRLLKKADPEELRTLQGIFCGESQSAKWRVAFTELIEAMQRSVDN